MERQLFSFIKRLVHTDIASLNKAVNRRKNKGNAFLQHKLLNKIVGSVIRLDKVIDAEEKFIIANLTKEASKVSVEQARKKIQWELLKDVSLHEKYINQSIDELDRLNF